MKLAIAMNRIPSLTLTSDNVTPGDVDMPKKDSP